jgi:hypothetical protein
LPCEVTAALVGEEILSIGEHRFNARKYTIDRKTSEGVLSTIVWLSGNDVVLAAQNQDPKLIGPRVIMSQFKKYSDF